MRPPGRSTQNRLQEAADVLRASGFSGWRFRIGNATVESGSFVQRPDLTIALAGPTHTELLLKDGSYYLRTRMPIRDRDTAVGDALAEEPFLALTEAQARRRRMGRYRRNGAMHRRRCAADGLHAAATRCGGRTTATAAARRR